MSLILKVETTTGKLFPVHQVSIPRGQRTEVQLYFYENGALLPCWDAGATIALYLYIRASADSAISDGKIETIDWERDEDNSRYVGTIDTTADIIGGLDYTTIFGRVHWQDDSALTGEQYTDFFHVQYRNVYPREALDRARKGMVNYAGEAYKVQWAGVVGKPDFQAMANAAIAAGTYTGIKFSSVTVLEAVDASDFGHGDIVTLQGYYGVGTEGGGNLWLDKSATLGAGARNGGTILTAAGGTNWYWRRVGTEKNVQQFGAKGDGTTDDHAAIQAAINAMEDGDDLIIPKGIYSVGDEVQFTNLRGINVYSQGTIKRADGTDTDDLVQITLCHNCTFHNLIVNGNRAGAVDIEVAGEQPNVILGAGCTNIRFLGGELNNAINCGVVFNGQCENILFDSVTLDNVGEHGFYVSGGENRNVTFRNIRIHDVGQNNGSHMTGHDSHGWKLRSTSGTGFADNEAIIWENCFVDLDANPKGVVTCGWVLFSLKGGVFRNCHVTTAAGVTGAPFLLSGDNASQTVEDLVIEGIKSSRHDGTGRPLFYNSGNSINVGRIVVKDSTFGDSAGMYLNRVNLVSVWENCTFKNCRITTDDISSYATVPAKTRFIGCEILDNGSSHWIDLAYMASEVQFENCRVAGATGGTGIFRLGASYAGLSKPVRFLNCEMDQGDASRLINTSGACFDLIEIIGGKCNGVINGAYFLQGDWDASANDPDLSAQKTFGHYWVVSAGGTQTLFNTASTTFAEGDLVVSLGSSGFTKYAMAGAATPAPKLVLRAVETGPDFAITNPTAFPVTKVNGLWGETESELEATFTWNPASIADGASETKNDINVPGALNGDAVEVFVPINLQGMTYSAQAIAGNTVSIRLDNKTGGAIDLASSGFWRVRVIRNPRNINLW